MENSKNDDDQEAMDTSDDSSQKTSKQVKKEKIHSCKFCDKAFTTKGYMKRHIQIIHEGKNVHEKLKKQRAFFHTTQ